VWFRFSSGVAVVLELFDVVHQAIQFPLPVHLLAAAQGEAIEPLVVAQVADTGSTVAKRRAIICLP